MILDWVPAHFPRDDWALARFDGTALYEHADPRRGAHPDWGTLVFNFGRNEVRNFLLANALYWLREYHADGLRVDAVASMLYLDYSRKAGRVDPEPVRRARGPRGDRVPAGAQRRSCTAREPGVISAAEESTAWPGVSRPTYLGGLGFGFKWNMGWMHDTLGYFQHDPIHRRYHHHELTFSLIYAFTENFILPLSHDEVVHGKGSLLDKMPGDRWQKLANLRSLYAYMWAHPGKKLLFMGGEFAQEARVEPRALARLAPARAARARRRAVAACATSTAPTATSRRCGSSTSSREGFCWLEANDADDSVVAFARASRDGERVLVCVGNLSPVPREGYRARPAARRAAGARRSTPTPSYYGGSDVGNLGGVEAEAIAWHGQPFSAELTLPPLGVCGWCPRTTDAGRFKLAPSQSI